MSRAVQAHYLEQVAFINRSNAVHVRQRFEQHDNLDIRAQLAELIGVRAQSVAFTRNATEALKGLIGGYNRIGAGDVLEVRKPDGKKFMVPMKPATKGVCGSKRPNAAVSRRLICCGRCRAVCPMRRMPVKTP